MADFGDKTDPSKGGDPHTDALQTDALVEEKDLDGLRGWLLLVALGVVVTPIRLIVSMIPLYSNLFTNGGWRAISTPDGEHYNPALMWYIGGEILFNVALLVASVYLAHLFFSKRPAFPKVYIGLVLVTIVMIPLDAYIGSFLLPGENMWDAQTAKEFARSVIAGLIWVPYMLVSRRVSATFRDRGGSSGEL